MVDVNSFSDTVQPPDIYLNGKRMIVSAPDDVNGDPFYNEAGQFPSLTDEDTTVHINTQEVEYNESTKEVTKRGMLLYQGDVLITITPDPKYKKNKYGNRNPDNQIIGKTNISENLTTGNRRSETYYTVNGKDPTRTQAHLYTKPFTVTKNLSGQDNLILKAATYQGGRRSEVRKVELRIVRTIDTTV